MNKLVTMNEMVQLHADSRIEKILGDRRAALASKNDKK